MDEDSLKKLSKSKLIELLLKQQKSIEEQRRPIPTPRKSVKEIVQQYEENIIEPPIPPPRTKKLLRKMAPIPPPPEFRDIPAPVPEKRTIISQVEKALKGYTQSFDVELRDKKDPLVQSQKSRRAVEYLFKIF